VINKKLSIAIKKFSAKNLRHKILNKIEDISKEIDLSNLVKENKVMIISTKIEMIKTILRTSYEYLINQFEMEIEEYRPSFN
jgi:hypothetical protein